MPWWLRWSPLIRRSINDRWYQPILRIQPPDAPSHLQRLEFRCQCGPGSPAGTYVAEFEAATDGEVSLFVNDAVLGWSGPTSAYYENNLGEAELAIEEVRPPKPGDAPPG